MNSAYSVGATFTIENLASPEIGKLSAQLVKLDEAIEETKLGLKNLLPTSMGAKVNALALEFDKLAPSAEKASRGMVEAMRLAGVGIDKSALEMKASLDGLFTGVFAGMEAEMTGATNVVVADFGRIVLGAENSVRAVQALREEMRLLGLANVALPNAPGAGGGRGGGGHVRPGQSSHGGLHMRGPSTHLPGVGHVGAGGDGLVPLVGGLAIGELIKTGVEHAFDMAHWESQFSAAGFNPTQIDGAKSAAWANAAANPNASATDGLKNILELNKATGNLQESEGLLGAFSIAETAMQSIKAENLHSKFNGGTQILNFAKGLEEMGITMRGDTEEERSANTKHYTNELLRTMISSRGLFDGNALFAMTNNSGGASQNWDERMGTVVAPILGDIMKHSKLGNADYMALKSYVGGGITSKATVGLLKYGLADESDTYTDKTGVHLSANSKFADGASENLLDWSGKLLERMEAHGVNIHDQKAINKVVNEIGSNKSTTMMMRALLEPGTRAQIIKEMALRDNVPEDAAGILQNRDPVLKMDALHKKLDDFFTALGGPLVDPAIAGLTKLTAGINALAQMMQAHPDLTKYSAEATGAAGLGLLGMGGAKMLGLWGKSDSGLGLAASKLDLAADHLMMVGGGVPGTPSSAQAGAAKTLGLMLSEGLASGMIYEAGKHAMDGLLGFSPKNQSDLDNATSGAATLDRLKKLLPDLDKSKPAIDPNAIPASGFVPMAYVTGLGDSAKLTTEKFTGLDQGSLGLDNAFRIVELTAMGAARALATLAMSGGTGSGVGGGPGGLINASWGGGGSGGSWNGNPLAIGGGFGSAGWSKSGATRSTVADYIRHAFGVQGIDPNTALRVAQSEGLNTYVGDHGTSFGAFQLHYGGSGIRGMNSGGLGDRFTKATGLNARDPSTWKAQIDYAAKTARAEGWGAWHGAQRVGIGNHQGIGTYRGNPSTGDTAGSHDRPTVVHTHVHLDGKIVAANTMKHFASNGRFPTGMGSVDGWSHYSNGAGTPVIDAA